LRDNIYRNLQKAVEDILCLQRLSVNFLQKTLNHFIMVHMPRNDILSQGVISRIILHYKLPLQSVMLGLGGFVLKTKIFAGRQHGCISYGRVVRLRDEASIII